MLLPSLLLSPRLRTTPSTKLLFIMLDSRTMSYLSNSLLNPSSSSLSPSSSSLSPSSSSLSPSSRPSPSSLVVQFISTLKAKLFSARPSPSSCLNPSNPPILSIKIHLASQSKVETSQLWGCLCDHPPYQSINIT